MKYDPYAEKQLVQCNCSCADECPQGKTGMATLCRVWVFKKRLKKRERT